MEARASVHGKIILSGEHAVVYGAPALITAVPQTFQCCIIPVDEPSIRIETALFPEPLSIPRAGLSAFAGEVDARYEAFRRGVLPVDQILRAALELPLYALWLAAEARVLPDGGLRVVLSSDLPLGSGMGSSAACVCAVLRAVELLAGIKLPQLYAQACRAERLQHGRPSGADVYACLNGGLIRFQSGAAERVGAAPESLHFEHWGTPESSTGECVAQVQKQFGSGYDWSAFGRVTYSIQDALLCEDRAALIVAVRENHRLLCDIGVVPDLAMMRIAELESVGGAGKICGAGAVRGNGAGMVWVVKP